MVVEQLKAAVQAKYESFNGSVFDSVAQLHDSLPRDSFVSRAWREFGNTLVIVDDGSEGEAVQVVLGTYSEEEVLDPVD